jgi:hypothetical protein
MCHKQNKPGWLGNKVLTNNNGVYTFFKVDGTVLTFEFNTLVNDTNMVYTDGSQILKMSYANTTSAQILGYTDSVRYYHLYHTDIMGNPIASGLNQYQLAVGKDLGLINFLKIDSFPQQIKTLELLGDKSTALGYYQLTNEMLYDYAIGDEYQWRESSTQMMFPITITNYNYFVKYGILNKTLTVDSILYLCERTKIDLVSNTQTIDTVNLNYLRNHVISEIPYEIFNGSDYQNFKQTSFCGESYWQLNTANEPYNLSFCEVDSCWGGVDTQGPAAEITNSYVLGLGNVAHHDNLFASPNFNGHSINSVLEYFKKNGVTCGTQQLVGVNKPNVVKPIIQISPNPASDNLYFTLNGIIKAEQLQINLLDLQGGRLITQQVNVSHESATQQVKLSLGNLANGVYFVQVSDGLNLIESAKFVKN